MTSAFECERCGRCCEGEKGIVVTPEDARRLSDFLKLPESDMLRTYTEESRGKRYLIVGEDNMCVFFRRDAGDGKPGCSIHLARPDVCRAWPFFRGNLVDSVSWEMAAEDCPGIHKDVAHAEFVRQGLRYLQEHISPTARKNARGKDGAGALDTLNTMDTEPE